MSDLEATSSRGQAAAPITAIATGKLRAFSGNRPLFAQSDGLVDAFAEVFASMAESSFQPVQAPVPVAEPESNSVVSDQKPTDSQDEASSESDTQAELTNALHVELETLATEVQSIDVAVDAGPVVAVAYGDESVDLPVEDGPSDIVDVPIAAVAVQQSEIDSAPAETPDHLAGQVARIRRHQPRSARTPRVGFGGTSREPRR